MKQSNVSTQRTINRIWYATIYTIQVKTEFQKLIYSMIPNKRPIIEIIYIYIYKICVKRNVIERRKAM